MPGSRLPTKPGLAVLTACVTLLVVLLPPPVEAAAPLVSPSGAGTVVIGPQAMEGNLQIHPGDALRAGFDFTMPGSHPAATASFYNGSIALLVTCANGAAPALAINLPAQTITDPSGSPSWYPSGDQSSSLVFQGTLTAPDLCAGGVMNDANGATFTTTFFSTDTIDKVNFRFHYSDNTAGSWSATIQGTPTPFAKTVTSATLTPALSLGLSTDHVTAIPGDAISYTATVTNTGSTLAVSGDFVASATGSETAVVASYWDDVSTSPDGTTWTPLAGSSAAQNGYTPAVAAPITSGMTLAATTVAATGVTYPTSADRILGTSIATGSTATWHYAASVPLTPAQAAALVDPTKVKKVRNSFHLEVSPANPNVTQPAIIDVDFSTLFFGASPSASVSNVKVTIQPPQNAAALVFSSGNTPALATLAPGASAPVTGTFQVPLPAAKGTQSDSSYFTSLSTVEGTLLTASSTASGTAPTGTITATPPPNVSTTEHLPIVSVKKSGPAVINAGDTETNPLALKNNGGATAASLSVVDAVTGGGSGTVGGVPASLAAGASASASATYPVPTSQPSGGLTDTASVTWTDANGNSYGSLSDSFTTQVQNILFGATLTLAPAKAGPNVPGTSQQLMATLVDSHGNPIPNQLVHFTVTGANPGSGTATTDANGNASFAFTGTNPGTDSVQATVTGPGITIASNTSTVSWLKQLQPVATAPIQGNFYANTANSCTFDIGPSATPVFGQTFPDILFNPASTVVPHDISTVGNFTRPFTDLTVDVNGNYNGQIVAQGNGQQAGTGSLINFYGVFSGTFVINQPGDLTFRILHDDGYIIGVGGGATRVNGDFEGNPPATTPFNGYGVVAAWNTGSSGSSSSGPATVHFPAAGTYPFELDYTECGAGALFLNLLTEQFVAQTNPLAIYVGYADALRAGGSAFPFPWDGSPNTNFFGCPGCPYDAGAIRFDNNSQTSMTFDSITVDVGTNHFDLWPHAFTLPAGQILILTMTVNDNFDTSDFSGSPCNVNNGVIPKVNVTIAGTTTSYSDVNQILNTGGFDLACLRNESLPWRSINGAATAINLPVPPAASLNLTPFNIPGATQGQSVSLTVSALDGAGNPAVNLPVTLQVLGANTQTLNGTTGTNGLATFTYLGVLTGSDSVQASAFVGGLRAISNQGSVVWTPPGGTNNPLGPSISSPTPADGSVVTKPVAVTATIAPPSGQTIASWRVFYQALDPGSPVTINSGTGTPPSPLATFDPTVLPNDTYGITVEATASNGAVQDLTTTVTVLGNLKPGRYVTTFDDLRVPLTGISMDIQRNYDSFDKSRGDFGVGWRVSVGNFRTSPNRVLGAGGWTQYNQSCGFGLCLTGFRNSAPRFVSVTFPDQHTEVFNFTPTGGTNFFWTGAAAFTAQPGTATTSTLVALGDTSLNYTGDGNLYGSTGVYDPQRFLLTTVDGRQFVLDRTTGLVSETDLNGNRLTVSGSGVQSSAGPSINFIRDTTGRITEIDGPSTQHLLYQYSAAGDLATVIDGASNATNFTYDLNHNLLTVSGPGAPFDTYQYDSSGRLTSVTDGNGNTVSVTNNVGTQQQTFVDAAHQLTTVNTLDALGDVVEQDQIFGGTTLTSLRTYDLAGHQTGEQDPLGYSWSAQYDSIGNLVLYSDPNKQQWSYAYNQFGGVTSVTGPGNTLLETRSYDARGNMTRLTQADSSYFQFFYDSSGRLTQRIDPANRSLQFFYDGAGHLARLQQPDGASILFNVDASGRVLSQTDARGGITRYAYDGNNRITAVTDANLNTRHYAWSFAGELKNETDAAGKQTQYNYDASLRLSSVLTRDGALIQYAYDPDGRINSQILPGNDLTTYVYDALGHVVRGTNATADVQLGYDPLGRLIAQTTGSGSASNQPAVTLNFGYDLNGNRTSLSGPEGQTSYAFDAFNRLTSITDPAHGQFTFSYDALSRLTQMGRPNGVADTFQYDASSFQTRLTSANGPTTISQALYVPDANGNRASLTDLTGLSSYTRDPAGDLVAATHPPGGAANETYSYDLAGNRTASATTPAPSIVYDVNNRLTSDGFATYTYDAEGNLVTRVDRGTGLPTNYVWNAVHQLQSIHFSDGSVTTYRYDPFGHRVEVSDGAKTARYVNDGDNIHLEFDGSNTLAASYISGIGEDSFLEMVRAGHSYYYLRDGLNSVVAIADGSGTVVQNYTYDSFGLQSSSGSITNPFSYTGREYDAKSGLYYYRARYYDPRSGRFISEDPVGVPNRYPYSNNDPVDQIDPLGNQAFIERESIEEDVTLREDICSEAAVARREAAAAAKYAGKAGRDELHHVVPRFLGGPADGPLAPVDAAYHQQLTNAFREAATSRGIGYGGRVLDPLNSASDLLDLITILQEVYSQLPLCL